MALFCLCLVSELRLRKLLFTEYLTEVLYSRHNKMVLLTTVPRSWTVITRGAMSSADTLHTKARIWITYRSQGRACTACISHRLHQAADASYLVWTGRATYFLPLPRHLWRQQRVHITRNGLNILLKENAFICLQRLLGIKIFPSSSFGSARRTRRQSCPTCPTYYPQRLKFRWK